MVTPELDKARSPKVSASLFENCKRRNFAYVLTFALEIYRDVPGARIPGGSEDVLMDLAVRQLVKRFQQKTKELDARTKNSRL